VEASAQSESTVFPDLLASYFAGRHELQAYASMIRYGRRYLQSSLGLLVGWNVKKTKSIVRLATLAAQHGLSGTNGVEDSLRNMSLADMSYGADLVKSMVASSGDIFAARRDFDPLELQGPNRR
jgi:hypothetical protein